MRVPPALEIVIVWERVYESEKRVACVKRQVVGGWGLAPLSPGPLFFFPFESLQLDSIEIRR